jgi:hypothetical protein
MVLAAAAEVQAAVAVQAVAENVARGAVQKLACRCCGCCYCCRRCRWLLCHQLNLLLLLLLLTQKQSEAPQTAGALQQQAAKQQRRPGARQSSQQSSNRPPAKHVRQAANKQAKKQKQASTYLEYSYVSEGKHTIISDGLSEGRGDQNTNK